MQVIEEVARKRAKKRVLESMKRCREEARKGGTFFHHTKENRNRRPYPSTDNKIEGHVIDVLMDCHQRELAAWDQRITQYEQTGTLPFLLGVELAAIEMGG